MKKLSAFLLIFLSVSLSYAQPSSAEILYRYNTRDNDFVESHTGLEDVDIERQILAYCFRKHKAMKKALWND